MKVFKSQLSVIGYQLSTISLLFTVFLPSPALSHNSGVVHIEAMGSAAIYENTANADILAMDDAFKRAVAKVVEAIVAEEEMDKLALILEDKIYSNAARYILNYRILSKEIMEDEDSAAEGDVPIHSAYIEADISVALLTKDLTAAGIIREGELRSIAITILNLSDYKTFEFFKRNILKAKGVKEVYYISFAKDKAVLAVETSSGVQALKQEIMAVDVKEWKTEVSVVSGIFAPDRIEIRFFPLKGQVSQ
ncbi:MAG: hypothetical protein HZB80_03195 [Deltaproteobacteria bacterium]|nr:hypothetical protein [Deltaproteobacteria bacterium]